MAVLPSNNSNSLTSGKIYSVVPNTDCCAVAERTTHKRHVMYIRHSCFCRRDLSVHVMVMRGLFIETNGRPHLRTSTGNNQWRWHYFKYSIKTSRAGNVELSGVVGLLYGRCVLLNFIAGHRFQGGRYIFPEKEMFWNVINIDILPSWFHSSRANVLETSRLFTPPNNNVKYTWSCT